MPEAARLGDTIGHASAMAGLMVGTVIGSLISAAGGILAGALFVAGLAASCIGVGVLLIGAAIAVGMAAGYLGDMARDWTAQGLMAWHQDARGLRCDYQWEQGEAGLWRVIAQQTSEGAGYRLESALSSTDYDFRQNLRYAGQYFDNETGLHFNTFRYYALNPLSWIDPWELLPRHHYLCLMAIKDE